MSLRSEPFTGPIPKPQSRAAQKKASDRTKEREWQKVRQAVLVRDRYRCRSCGTPEKVDVHHIRFRSMGGEDSTRNCAAMCRVCHAELHAYRLYAEGNDANKRLRFVRAK
jgi:5-methylcytosine-specific restriction endonuclease McrA